MKKTFCADYVLLHPKSSFKGNQTKVDEFEKMCCQSKLQYLYLKDQSDIIC